MFPANLLARLFVIWSLNQFVNRFISWTSYRKLPESQIYLMCSPHPLLRNHFFLHTLAYICVLLHNDSFLVCFTYVDLNSRFYIPFLVIVRTYWKIILSAYCKTIILFLCYFCHLTTTARNEARVLFKFWFSKTTFHGDFVIICGNICMNQCACPLSVPQKWTQRMKWLGIINIRNIMCLYQQQSILQHIVSHLV